MFYVELFSCGNVDRYEDPNLPVNGASNAVVEVASIEEAQTAVNAYIKNYDLGGGNWCGGGVYSAAKEFLGYISYNGRYWEKETTEEFMFPARFLPYLK